VNAEFPFFESPEKIKVSQHQATSMSVLCRQDTDRLQGFWIAGTVHSRRRQDSVAT